jgi:hypothetical protein
MKIQMKMRKSRKLPQKSLVVSVTANLKITTKKSKSALLGTRQRQQSHPARRRREPCLDGPHRVRGPGQIPRPSRLQKQRRQQKRILKLLLMKIGVQRHSIASQTSIKVV